jgi:hypothetical protein
MAVGMSQPASTPVIGRDDELDALRAFLDAVEQGPTALLLSGEPGIDRGSATSGPPGERWWPKRGGRQVRGELGGGR